MDEGGKREIRIKVISDCAVSNPNVVLQHSPQIFLDSINLDYMTL
jgi:hypothetical protein